MALRVEQHTVFCPVRATFCSPSDVMVVPSGQLGDFLVAQRADTPLFFPEVQQLPSSVEFVCHFEAEALFKVDFPRLIIRISWPLDFCVPLDRHICGLDEPDRSRRVVHIGYLATEHPVVATYCAEVALLDPSVALSGMSPFCPPPQGFGDCMAHGRKGVLTDDMLVVVCPATDQRVKLENELVRGRLLVGLDCLSDGG